MRKDKDIHVVDSVVALWEQGLYRRILIVTMSQGIWRDIIKRVQFIARDPNNFVVQAQTTKSHGDKIIHANHGWIIFRTVVDLKKRIRGHEFDMVAPVGIEDEAFLPQDALMQLRLGPCPLFLTSWNQ